MNEKQELLEELQSMGIGRKVLAAMRKTRRELFIPEELRKRAYENIPLPIGHDQTISQPFTVAFMIQLLDIKPGNKILEVGAGSGYNAAVMSHLVENRGRIVAVEIIRELAEFARKNIGKAGIKNVKVVHANGWFGYEKEAPYDRIIVTAGSPEIPEPLVRQLRSGGIMVIPVDNGFHQTMMRMVMRKGKPIVTRHGDFAFVPLRKE